MSDFFYTVEPDCVTIHWPLYPLALVSWLVLVPVIVVGLMLGVLD